VTQLSTELSNTVGLIVEAIRAHTRSARYERGSKLPSENKLASELGVSRGSVRKAIEVLVRSGELTRRLHERPRIGMPQPGRSHGSANEVHIWVSHPIADAPTLLFMKGMSAALGGTPYQMIVREPPRFLANYVKSDERQFLTDLLDNDDTVGAIIQRDPFADNQDLFEALIHAGKRLVFVDTPPPDSLSADHVGTANTAAARQCVDHLLSHGHRDIACVADSDVPRTIRERMAGYRRAMTQAGHEHRIRFVVPEKTIDESLPFRPVGGRFAQGLAQSDQYFTLASRIVDEILHMDPRPTALFVCYDVLAYYVCAHLEDAGLSIPDQMSVVGFDWWARWDSGVGDILTTAAQDFEGFGRHAVDLLLNRIEEVEAFPACRVLLDAPLVVRSSTAFAMFQASTSNSGG
jgi:LacI family transcriptional regulator